MQTCVRILKFMFFNFKIPTQVCMWDVEQEVKIGDMQQDATVQL
jgi:hypothetical protein